MSERDHRNEIIATVKQSIDNRQNHHMQFSDEQLKATRDAIFDQVYADIDRTASDQTPPSNDTASPHNWLAKAMALASDHIRALGRWRARQVALALLAVFGLSIFMVSQTGSRVTASDKLIAITGLSPVEALSAHALELATLVDQAPAGARALVSTNKTDRYRAFEAGVLIADIQMLSDHDIDYSTRLIDSYIARGLAFTAHTRGYDSHDVFYETVERLMQDREAAAWLRQGYLVETLYLTSIVAMHDLNTTALRDLLASYRRLAKQTFYGSQNNQYMHNHQILLHSNIGDQATPAEIDTLTEAIRNLKTLAQ